MSSFKKIVLIFTLIIIGVLEVLIYWNTHLYYRARKIEDSEIRLEILEKAKRVYPFNDLVYYELGKTYFDIGINNLADLELGNNYLQESINNFTRSIRINPAYLFSHFHFAQALLFLSYVSSLPDVSFFDEYKKAALLTGHNTEIFYEVGKILFSRWPALSEKERDFTLGILKKILTYKEKEKLQAIMHIWELNVKDYDVMGKILPDDSKILRLYAQFLGAKYLSLEKRQEMLARAEFLEFQNIRKAYSEAQRNFQYYRFQEAFNQFKHCLDGLNKIRFYQNLAGEELINPSGFSDLYKSVNLNLAKCLIENGQEFIEAQNYLNAYLLIEDNLSEIRELESYLNSRGVTEEKLEAKFDDLGLLSFRIFLYFKLNRYREIVRLGRLLQQSFVVVSEEKKAGYVKLLQLMGDSFQKVDYIYDAGEFYQKAIEIDPDNLETLLRIRINYERLNEKKKIQELDRRIKKLLAPEEIILKDYIISKSKNYSSSIILDGKRIALNLHFTDFRKEMAPLVSVFFNGRVVWEDYLKENIISITLKTKVGKNRLQITTINQPVTLARIFYK